MKKGCVGPALAWIAVGALIVLFVGDSGRETAATAEGSPPLTPGRSELAPVPLPPVQLPERTASVEHHVEAPEATGAPAAPELVREESPAPTQPEPPKRHVPGTWSDLGAQPLPGEERAIANQPTLGQFSHVHVEATLLRAQGTFERVALGGARVQLELRDVNTQQRVMLLRAQLSAEAKLDFMWQSYNTRLPPGRYELLLTLPMDLQPDPVYTALRQRHGYPPEARICLARSLTGL